jgi:Family of unknown function (DUF5984)
MQAGENALMEYSAEAIREFGDGITRYSSYTLSQQYGDLLDLIHRVMTPVPHKLQRYIALDHTRAMDHYLSKWCSLAYKLDPEGLMDERIGSAWDWISGRYFDMRYFLPAFNMYLWSDEKNVHIQWDNREMKVNGYLAWTAVFGSYTLSREQFMAEVRDFHERFMTQMGVRVAQVAAGVLPSHIHVDLIELQRQQELRASSLEFNMLPSWPVDDWPAAIFGVAFLESIRDDATT